MAKMTIVLTGDKQLDTRLRKLGSKQAKDILRKSAKHVLKPLTEKIKQATPTLTGDLEQNIKVRALKRSRKHIGAIIRSGNESGFNQGDLFYGAFVELGTKMRKHESGKSVGAIQPGVAFIRSTVDQYRDRTIKHFRAKVARMIETLATRG